MNQIDYMAELEDRGVDVVSRTRREVMCRCPLPDHDDSSPSFQLNIENGLWNCFGCGESGNWVQLVSVLDDCTIGEALRKFPIVTGIGSLADIRPKPKNYEPPLKYYNLKSFRTKFQPVMGTPGQGYLNARGVNDVTLTAFDIRYAGERTRDMRGRVIMPILSPEGRLVSFKGRAIHPDLKPKDKLARTAKHGLFGLYQLLHWSMWRNRHIRSIVLVEGEIDAMYLQQHGVPAVANGGTAKLSDQRVALIRKYAKRLVLSLDGDGPGEAAQWKIYEQLRGQIRVSTIGLPDGKDPNDLTPEEIDEIYEEVKR